MKVIIFSSVDDSHANGTSTVSLVHKDKKIILNCELRKSAYLWLSCGLKIRLGESPLNGIDLSLFDTITFDVDYTTPISNDNTQQPKLRIFLRSYDKGMEKIRMTT